VAEKLVEASNAHHHSLPLIVIDAQHVEMDLLSQALRSASATLNRVRCVLVVVIETMQKAQFPERLLHIFDSDFYLEPLTINEVQALVESRITTVSSEPFTLSFEDARYLREKSHGNPGALIRVLRNAVDASRNPGSLAGIDQILSLPTPPLSGHMDTSTPVETRPLQSSLEEVESNEQHEQNEQHEPQDSQGWASLPTGDHLASEHSPEVPEESEYIDASTPWTERQTLRNQEDDVKIIENVLGFELNLEQLDEEKSSDAELPELPYKALPQTPEFAAAAEATPPTIVNGPFSGLVGRLRDTKASPGSEEQAGQNFGSRRVMVRSLSSLLNQSKLIQMILQNSFMMKSVCSSQKSMSLRISCLSQISLRAWPLLRLLRRDPCLLNRMPWQQLYRPLQWLCLAPQAPAGYWFPTSLYRCFSQTPT
jgi:hypothetical protein